MHLQNSLKIEKTPIYLGDNCKKISEYLREERNDINSFPGIGTIPPSKGSVLISRKKRRSIL